MKELVIELKDGKCIEQSWVLKNNKKYVIGRSPDVDITVTEATASRKHALIKVLPEGSATIQDLNSANGTFVDGKRIDSDQMIVIKKGTQIALGEMTKLLIITFKKALSEENSDDEQAVKKSKKLRKEKPIEHKKDSREVSESPSKKKIRKDRNSESKSPKKKIKNQSRSRSRSRSSEKEEDSYSVQAKKNQKSSSFTIKYPTKKSNTDLESNLAKEPNSSTKSQGYGSLGLEKDDQNKFLKLMGVKNPDQIQYNDAKNLAGLKYLKNDMSQFQQRQQKMNRELENQFTRGVMNRFGGKGGLGFQ